MRGRKPNVIACIHCRQMKLACDRSLKFPAACSRCAKVGKICSVDPAFKRTKKRQRLMVVERELREIKQSLNTAHSRNDDPPIATPVQTHLSSPPGIGKPDTDFWPSARSIQGVELPGRLVKDLLTEFFAVYHPFCPILPDLPAFIDYSEPSPLLSWTVLAIALRGKASHKDLYTTVADAVRTMAYATVQPANASFRSMQALLLLCHWPLPFHRLDDPSHAFIALATHMGLRMGLHRPCHVGEFRDASAAGEMGMLRRRTWVACFITNISVSSNLGLPATLHLDHSLLELLAAQPAWLPDTLHQQLHIFRHLLNICSTLGNCESSSSGLLPEPMAVIRTFEAELRALEVKFRESWSPTEYMVFLGCRMILYTLALSSETPNTENSSGVGIESSSHWLIQGYMTATTIIHTASSMRHQLFHAPFRLHKILLGATCFLLLVKCSRHDTLVDPSTLCNSISQAWETLKSLSLGAGDLMSRSCVVVEQLSRYSDTLRSEDKDQTDCLFSVRSRMGANATTTLLLRARDYRRKCRDEARAKEAESAAPDVVAPVVDMDQMVDGDWFADITDVDWDALFSDINVAACSS